MRGQPRQPRGSSGGGRFAARHDASDTQLSDVHDRDRETLQDLRDFFTEARLVASRGEEAFKGDRILQLAGEAVVTRIAEAVSRLSHEYKNAHNDVPWHLIRGMRNIIIHDYHKTSLEDVWVTLQKDLPNLARLLGF
jgi:uncharacterized protein with HEPN domain